MSEHAPKFNSAEWFGISPKDIPTERFYTHDTQPLTARRVSEEIQTMFRDRDLDTYDRLKAGEEFTREELMATISENTLYPKEYVDIANANPDDEELFLAALKKSEGKFESSALVEKIHADPTYITTVMDAGMEAPLYAFPAELKTNPSVIMGLMAKDRRVLQGLYQDPTFTALSPEEQQTFKQAANEIGTDLRNRYMALANQEDGLLTKIENIERYLANLPDYLKTDVTLFDTLAKTISPGDTQQTAQKLAETYGDTQTIDLLSKYYKNKTSQYFTPITPENNINNT